MATIHDSPRIVEAASVYLESGSHCTFSEGAVLYSAPPLQHFCEKEAIPMTPGAL